MPPRATAVITLSSTGPLAATGADVVVRGVCDSGRDGSADGVVVEVLEVCPGSSDVGAGAGVVILFGEVDGVSFATAVRSS